MPGRNDFDNENVNYPEGKQKRVAWHRVDIETTMDVKRIVSRMNHEEDRDCSGDTRRRIRNFWFIIITRFNEWLEEWRGYLRRVIGLKWRSGLIQSGKVVQEYFVK